MMDNHIMHDAHLLHRDSRSSRSEDNDCNYVLAFATMSSSLHRRCYPLMRVVTLLSPHPCVLMSRLLIQLSKALSMANWHFGSLQALQICIRCVVSSTYISVTDCTSRVTLSAKRKSKVQAQVCPCLLTVILTINDIADKCKASALKALPA